MFDFDKEEWGSEARFHARRVKQLSRDEYRNELRERMASAVTALNALEHLPQLMANVSEASRHRHELTDYQKQFVQRARIALETMKEALTQDSFDPPTEQNQTASWRRIKHVGWWLMHNVVAHPLIGMLPIRWTFEFHDWTSKKLNGG